MFVLGLRALSTASEYVSNLNVISLDDICVRLNEISVKLE